MKTLTVSIVSDLHLEVSSCELNNDDKSDVLVLAGDIVPILALHQGKHRFYHREFFGNICDQWKHVIMVMGNHEHYGYDMEHTKDMFEALVDKDNFHILENEVLNVEGVNFLGCTLWTQIEDPSDELIIKEMMNDYWAITLEGKVLSVEDTNRINYKSVGYITHATKDLENVFVVTHHTPSFKSVHPRYESSVTLNKAFHNHLDYLIESRNNIKYWVHGHTHDPVDYMIGNTRVLCNPRGYVGYESVPEDYKPVTVEVEYV